MSTPITAFYAGLLAFVYIYLSILVIRQRRSLKIGLGDGEDKHFLQLLRAHANFAAYVPMTLILMLLAELNKGSFDWIHVCGVAILFGRLMHAYGLRHHYGASWQRIWGMLLTFAAIVIGGVLNLLLFYI